MKVCVLIPVHNEARTIASLIACLKEEIQDIIIVDDGSIDGSGQLACAQGAHVIVHQQKQGKGSSLRDGFDYVVRHGFDGVVTMDGDGQHAVSDIGIFLAKAQELPETIISGSRIRNCPNMPRLRYLTNQAMSWLISVFCHQPIEDSQCGFRFIPINILKQIKLYSSDFQIETEVLLRASRKGFKTYFVPIQTIYHDETSKIRPLVDTLRFFAFMLREWNRKQ
jgi:glycosyltransferase involved in cell wall biosynthesis